MRGADIPFLNQKASAGETSPHAWSRFNNLCHLLSSPRKHLHMRGADFLFLSSRWQRLETSPHAWSRYFVCRSRRRLSGNISTCVEQIRPSGRRRPPGWKHLHMRGADKAALLGFRLVPETSPHAWSRSGERGHGRGSGGNISTCVEQIKRDDGQCHQIGGNISTCVEQISPFLIFRSIQSKHLHMRGADR